MRAAIKALPILAALLLAHEACAEGGSGAADFLDRWLALSDSSKEEQPHWMTPVVTVTPRLEQELRYDQSWQNRPAGVSILNYGGGKGLELIPTRHTELIIGVPAYQLRSTPKGNAYGFADETLLLKYRALAANEENGNYVVSGFFGLSVPTGSDAFTSHSTLITPTLAAGKGWGSRQLGFDVQSTLGITIPTADKGALGAPITWNTALQAHAAKLWPQVEVNYTYYDSGPHGGKTQVAVTPGIVFGRFAVEARMKLIVGAGYQKTVSSFHIYNNAWIMTARAAF